MEDAALAEERRRTAMREYVLRMRQEIALLTQQVAELEAALVGGGDEVNANDATFGTGER